MKDYDFVMKFDLPEIFDDPENYIDALYEAGCDDAVIGFGQSGSIVLYFIRQSKSVNEALLSAIADVKKAIPSARIIDTILYPEGIAAKVDIMSFNNINIQNLH